MILIYNINYIKMMRKAEKTLKRIYRFLDDAISKKLAKNIIIKKMKRKKNQVKIK